MDGFADSGRMRVGQHYVYRVGRNLTRDEAIVALNRGTDVTFRFTTVMGPPGAAGAGGSVLGLKRSRATVVTRTMPRDVAAFLHHYEPERIPQFGPYPRGYDAQYFKGYMAAFAYGRAFPAEQLKGHETLVISGQRFNCAIYEGSVLARTSHGCVTVNWRKAIADRYPFTIRFEQNGMPVANLTAIK